MPATWCPGLEEPFSIPAAALRKYEVGGEVVVKENVRSDCVYVYVDKYVVMFWVDVY